MPPKRARQGPAVNGMFPDDRLVADAQELQRRLREDMEAMIANSESLVAEFQRKETRTATKNQETRDLEQRLQYNEGRVHELTRVVNGLWTENYNLREQLAAVQQLLDSELTAQETNAQLAAPEQNDTQDVRSYIRGS